MAAAFVEDFVLLEDEALDDDSELFVEDSELLAPESPPVEELSVEELVFEDELRESVR